MFKNMTHIDAAFWHLSFECYFKAWVFNNTVYDAHLRRITRKYIYKPLDPAFLQTCRCTLSSIYLGLEKLYHVQTVSLQLFLFIGIISDKVVFSDQLISISGSQPNTIYRLTFYCRHFVTVTFENNLWVGGPKGQHSSTHRVIKDMDIR